MTHQVQLTRQAAKHLAKITTKDQARLKRALEKMKTDPFSGDVVKLVGYDAYRRRVGSYRIIFSLDESRIVILVLDILRRNEKTYT
jgi:mRNA interferase RelE/StbE